MHPLDCNTSNYRHKDSFAATSTGFTKLELNNEFTKASFLENDLAKQILTSLNQLLDSATAHGFYD